MIIGKSLKLADSEPLLCLCYVEGGFKKIVLKWEWNKKIYSKNSVDIGLIPYFMKD